MCARPGCGRELPPRRRRYCSDNCRKRACESAHRATCIDCGTALTTGSAWRGHVRCRSCHVAHVNEQTVARRLEIQRLWHEGLRAREIAAAMGSTTGSIGVEIRRMRIAGWDLPFRRQQRVGGGIA
jgi:DNA-binding NarL/FixJ family response regulator